MPLIKPRTRGKQIVRHIARLDRENNETLHAYAAFLGESTDYVLNQVTVFAPSGSRGPIERFDLLSVNANPPLAVRAIVSIMAA